MSKDERNKINHIDDSMAKESNLQKEPISEDELKEIAGGKSMDIPTLISTAYKVLRK